MMGASHASSRDEVNRAEEGKYSGEEIQYITRWRCV